VTELESKYSSPVETGLIIVFVVGLLAVMWGLYRYVINLDFVYYLVGESYLARKALVTLFLLCFVLFFYRPLIKSVLYHEQKKSQQGSSFAAFDRNGGHRLAQIEGALCATDNITYHSKAIRILAYFCGFILLPLFAFGVVLPFYFLAIYFGVVHSDLHANEVLILLFSFIGLYFVRCFFLLYRFLTTLKVSLNYDENGISLMNGNDKVFFPWEELSGSKDHRDCQIFSVIGPDKQHIVSLWDYATNIQNFREAFDKHANT
jgi:hypothetical protein